MAENAATELKNSSLLQGKWDEQFSSAPKALGSLATLLVESSTSSSNVRMNIVQSADIGRRTFQQAIQNMDNIQMQFKQQSNLPMQLIQAIYESQGDPDVGRMVLPQLNTIERGFQSVTQLVNQVTQGFDQWARSVAELQDLSSRENLSETLQQSVKQLQQQSTDLASFFGAYRSLVEATYTQHVRKTTETAGPIFGSGQSPSESQRSELISSLAALRLYLTTLASVAQLWSEVSRDSIFPGLRLVDELGALAGQGAGEGEILKKKSSEVDRWSQQAAGRVEEVAREKQQQTLEIIDQNAQKLKRMLANAN